ncbi:MAG: hypothetical protein GY730_07400 [bacterium]|nr:hypothetical protein [bacterium]
MYTDGIRKILIIENKWYGSIDKLENIAQITGHEAILHNGQVYIKVGKIFALSPFCIDDFKNI